MKRLDLVGGIAAIFVAAVISSCDKEYVEINQQNIIGTWVEDYSDYPYYASEGGATWTFAEDHKVAIHFYDVFAGDHDMTRSYFVGGEFGSNIIVFDPFMSDCSGESFKIVKLTKREMEWQREGTEFSPGTLGSEFKHFVRKK